MTLKPFPLQIMGLRDQRGGCDLQRAQDECDVPGLGQGRAEACLWLPGQLGHRLGRGGGVWPRQAPGAQGQSYLGQESDVYFQSRRQGCIFCWLLVTEGHQQKICVWKV